MQSLAINLSVLISMIDLARNSGPPFPYCKKTLSQPPPGENINAYLNTTAQSESTLLALAFLLIFIHGYYSEKRYKYIKIRDEDLGLMKIVQDNAARVWEKQI